MKIYILANKPQNEITRWIAVLLGFAKETKHIEKLFTQ
jgi:hypothetical protein